MTNDKEAKGLLTHMGNSLTRIYVHDLCVEVEGRAVFFVHCTIKSYMYHGSPAVST